MPSLNNAQVKLNYEASGDGFPVILLHGFGMSARSCWVDTGWLDLLSRRGFRAVALDSRGHGRSDKPISASEYAAATMTSDVICLLDHLGIGSAHFIGHSMGARTAFDIALNYPDRLVSMLGVSIAANLFEHIQSRPLIDALRGTNPTRISQSLVELAENLLALGNDRDALVACLSSPRPVPKPEDLGAIDRPVRVACGENDSIVGDTSVLASSLKQSAQLTIAGCEHTDILASKELQDAAIEFLITSGKA